MMSKDLISKYEVLVQKYPNLCFKIYDENEDKYNLCIVTNKGIICYDVEEEIYSKFDIYNMESYKKECLISGDFISGNDDSLDDLDLNNVEAFFANNSGYLIDYFGNKEEVILPDSVRLVAERVFINNEIIKSIKGRNVFSVREIFNMKNLEKIEFDKMPCEYAESLFFDFRGVSNLKEINLSDVQINIDKNQVLIKTDSKTSQYFYDENLDKKISEYCYIIKDENNPDDFLPCIFFKEQDKRFHCKKEDFYTFLYRMCFFEVEYEKKNNFIKNVLDNDNYAYLIGNLSIKDSRGVVGGFCDEDKKIICVENNNIYFSDNFWHEIGHGIDSALGNISDSNIFNKIYNKEKVNSSNLLLVTNHVLSCSSEYFAFCFSSYINNEYCKEIPSSFEFMDKLIKGINKKEEKIDDNGIQKKIVKK